MNFLSSERYQRICAALFCATAFFSISRMLDVTPPLQRLLPVLIGLCGAALLASPRRFQFLKTTAGKVLVVFSGWVVLAHFLGQHAPLGALYTKNLLIGALLFAAAGMLSSAADFGLLVRALACAGLVAAALGLAWSTSINGRLSLRGGPYLDPNYYAMWLLPTIPLIWTAAVRRPLAAKIGAAALTALPLFLYIKTSSRAGLVSIGAMFLAVFLFSSLKGRFILGGIGAIGVVVLLAFLPNTLRSRIAASNAHDQARETDSNNARIVLLQTSLAVTINDPVFGIGPGSFPSYVEEVGRMRGETYTELNTHNAYTQISSETGVPGFLLYVLLIAFSFRNVISLIRQTSAGGQSPDPDLHALSKGVFVSLASVVAFLFFISEGYAPNVLLWLGIASGLRLVIPEPERAKDDEDEYEEEAVAS